MKRLLRQAEATSPETAEIFRVIDEFDGLTAGQFSLEDLVAASVKACGRTVAVLDTLNGRSVFMESGSVLPLEVSEEDRTAVVTAALNARLRGRRSSIMDVGEQEVLASSLETASGRIGLVWLERGESDWRLLDHVVAERLAVAAVTSAIQVSAAHEASLMVDSASVERLIAGGISASEAAVHVRQAGLTLGRPLVAVAIGEYPRASSSVDALAKAVSRELNRERITSRSSIIAGRAALVVENSPRLVDVLNSMNDGTLGFGSKVNFGVGNPMTPEHLSLSWDQATEALLLQSLGPSDSRVTRFSELGLLHLLALIPESEVVTFSDYVKVQELASQGSQPSDLELLEAFCETGSLRGAASAVFLHFTSVRSRLARISAKVGLDLSNPSDRLRAHVAVKLAQIHRIRLLDEAALDMATDEDSDGQR